MNGSTMCRSVSIFVLFALFSSAMGAVSTETYEAAKKECIQEIGIDPELLKGPPAMDGLMDDKMKCFFACIMKHFDEFTADGTMDLPKAISDLPADAPEKEKMIAALTACADKKGANDCETAQEIVMCLHENKFPMSHS